MAFTQTDLVNIRAAIASGVMKVRYADGANYMFPEAEVKAARKA